MQECCTLPHTAKLTSYKCDSLFKCYGIEEKAFIYIFIDIFKKYIPNPSSMGAKLVYPRITSLGRSSSRYAS